MGEARRQALRVGFGGHPAGDQAARLAIEAQSPEEKTAALRNGNLTVCWNRISEVSHKQRASPTLKGCWGCCYPCPVSRASRRGNDPEPMGRGIQSPRLCLSRHGLARDAWRGRPDGHRGMGCASFVRYDYDWLDALGWRADRRRYVL